TIFLDEIGDISLAMQSKLLKVIESRTMRRLGGLKDIPVKGRIVAATSVDLTAKMKSGQFRKDLYHRLKIIPLEIPPLRERRGDILSLVDSFVRLFNGIYGKSICGTTPEALDLLTDHEWEGNVRELKHTIERAVLLEEQEWLTEKDFDFLNTRGMLNGVEYENRSNGNVLHPIHKDSTLTFTISLAEAALEDVQLRLALNVLNHVGGNKSKAAAIMRISRPRLDRILATANN
ncbi:MAG: sigma 54-interacting transcriptional regulator, partial [Ignavibacteriae bacterium]|nr:sigma 54-interacting transcriptional regulator [Ignavibacteriota bacterium]